MVKSKSPSVGVLQMRQQQCQQTQTLLSRMHALRRQKQATGFTFRRLESEDDPVATYAIVPIAEPALVEARYGNHGVRSIAQRSRTLPVPSPIVASRATDSSPCALVGGQRRTGLVAVVDQNEVISQPFVFREIYQVAARRRQRRDVVPSSAGWNGGKRVRHRDEAKEE